MYVATHMNLSRTGFFINGFQSFTSFLWKLFLCSVFGFLPARALCMPGLRVTGLFDMEHLKGKLGTVGSSRLLEYGAQVIINSFL